MSKTTLTEMDIIIKEGDLGWVKVGDILTTAQLDSTIEHKDLWPEGNRYAFHNHQRRMPLIIRYWKKVTEDEFVLDKEDKALLDFKSLTSSFGPSGMKTYLSRRLNFKYNHPYLVSWKSDDPDMAYLAISDPVFSNLREAAKYIMDELNKTPQRAARHPKDLTIDNIIAQQGIKTLNLNNNDYPGGQYIIKHQRFHLELDYPKKPDTLYTVKWVSDCKKSYYNIHTEPVLSSMQETIRYIQDEVSKNGQFAIPKDYKRNMLFDKTASTRLLKEREVVMISVFNNSIVGKYVIEELDPKDVIGSWAYQEN